MPRCIGILKKGTQCVNNANYGRCCGMHDAQGLVSRPDITEVPVNPPPRKSKLDPYYTQTCRVFECEDTTVFGEFVCVNHYNSLVSARNGLANERERFTPYFQQLVVQQLANPQRDDPAFQQRIREDKQRRNELSIARWIRSQGRFETRQLDPFYITQCQSDECTTANRFGRFTCVAHRLQEDGIRFTLSNNADAFTLRYQNLLWAELHHPQRNDPDFQERIRERKAQREARRQQRIPLPQVQLNQLINNINNPPQQEDEQGRWIFQRDPEGGVNLQALANDRQSVHRSSVQEETIKNIQEIMKVPLIAPILPELWDSHYVEFLTEIDDAKLFTTEQYEKIRYVFGYEVNPEVASFNIRFVDLFGYVWSYIKPHKDKVEMMRRLGEELMDSRGMCSNGKIARLVNAVQGFMDGLLAPVNKMEVFQGKIAMLMELPFMKRVASALELFKEFEIPEDQQETWFSPLVT
jgi:hypothetical protein